MDVLSWFTSQLSSVRGVKRVPLTACALIHQTEIPLLKNTKELAGPGSKSFVTNCGVSVCALVSDNGDMVGMAGVASVGEC